MSVISFTVPHNAPNTLYYYCTNHSGMGNSISVTTDETKADPYAWKNVLALPLVGSANDVSNLVNSGSTTKAITINGSADSDGISNFYGESFGFVPGSSQYLSTPGASVYAFGTQPFTVELWYYNNNDQSGCNYNQIIGNIGGSTAGYWRIGTEFANAGEVYFTYTTGGYVDIRTGVNCNDGKWHHIAVVREGTGSNQTKIYIDGIQRAVGTTPQDLTSTATLYLMYSAQHADPNRLSAGNIQDARIYNGVAKYTSNFVVPTTAPDILPDTPSGVSGGSKLAKITEGAVSFDGTGDYLTLSGSDLAMGTGDFTLECYVYRPSSVTAFTNFIATRGASASANGFTFGAQASSNGYDVEFYTNGLQLDGGSQLVTPNKWHHVAVTRSGSTLRSYVNGIFNTTASNSQDFSTTSMAIGMTNDGSQGPMNGFISNVRVIKGTAIYTGTSSFTPPTRELTNVTNTKLLCCQSNTSAAAAAVSPSLSAAINDGTVWSDFLSTAGGFGGTHVRVRAFDGDTGTMAGTAANTGYSVTGNYNNALEFIPASPIAYSSSIKVRGRNTGQTTMGVKIDTGSGYGSEIALSSDTLQTVVSGSGNLVRMQVVTKTYSGENELGGIAIDDVYLTDPVTVYGDTSATTFNPFNTDINAVRGQETGYNTLNPLAKASITLSNGNLDLTHSGSTGYWQLVLSTIGMSSGKFYCEFLCQDGDSVIGIAKGNHVIANDKYVGQDPGGYSYNGQNGQKINNSSGSSYGSSYTAGDVIGIAFDGDNGTLRFYKNNIDQGQAFSGLTDEYFFAFSIRDTGHTHSVNFGQNPFKFPPPDGFQSLNLDSIRPETVIVRPDQYVGATLYSGNNGTTQVTTGFQPDFVWLKGRSEVLQHRLVDSVRGQKQLYSNSTAVQGDWDKLNILSNGFNVTNDGNEQNKSGTTYVSWCWKAGGNKGSFNVDDVGYENASDVNMNVGGLNSSLFNQSQTWSNFVTGSAYSGFPFTNAFSGNLSNRSMGANNAGGLTFTPPSAITVSSSLRVYFGYADSSATNAFKINGIDYSSLITSTGAIGWVSFPGITSITSIFYGVTSGGSETASISAIEVDGKLLVNPGINIPTIANTGASVGTKQGFSIVKATLGTASGNVSIPHGLGKTPDFIIAKSLTNTYNWDIYHKDATPGGSNRLILNSTAAVDSQDPWGNVAPTSSAFTFNAGFYNDASDSVIYYSWADVPGLQKFGDYLSQGGNDANFVELGFRPAILWIKSYVHVANTTSWCIFTDETDKSNPFHNPLYANNTAEEGKRGNNVNSGTFDIDLLSNGFKIRTNVGEINEGAAGGGSGDYYLYCAWAKAPAFNLYGAQSNAR